MNYIYDISAHNTRYDISSDRSKYAHFAKSANYCVDDTGSTYHFSATNVGDIKLYDTTATRIFNEQVDEITPKMNCDESIPAYFLLKNNVENKTVVPNYTVYEYSMNNTQANYTVNPGTISCEAYGSMTEYQLGYNFPETSNATARVPFRFTACLTRKTGVGYTPDFDNGKPLAKLTKIYGVPLSSLYVKGPAYILGSCIRRQLTTGSYNSAFPKVEYRLNSREMIFWMNLDETSSDYGGIYLCTSNCRFGTTKSSVYHCSYTDDDCKNSPCIELCFNTVLYVMYA